MAGRLAALLAGVLVLAALPAGGLKFGPGGTLEATVRRAAEELSPRQQHTLPNETGVSSPSKKLIHNSPIPHFAKVKKNDDFLKNLMTHGPYRRSKGVIIATVLIIGILVFLFGLVLIKLPAGGGTARKRKNLASGKLEAECLSPGGPLRYDPAKAQKTPSHGQESRFPAPPDEAAEEAVCNESRQESSSEPGGCPPSRAEGVEHGVEAAGRRTMRRPSIFKSLGQALHSRICRAPEARVGKAGTM